MVSHDTSTLCVRQASPHTVLIVMTHGHWLGVGVCNPVHKGLPRHKAPFFQQNARVTSNTAAPVLELRRPNKPLTNDNWILHLPWDSLHVGVDISCAGAFRFYLLPECAQFYGTRCAGTSSDGSLKHSSPFRAANPAEPTLRSRRRQPSRPISCCDFCI